MKPAKTTHRQRLKPAESDADSAETIDAQATARAHMRFGWWSLLAFLSMGIALETMLGFKLGYYLDVANETRRMMWRLAHAHGTLFALINIGFALTVAALHAWPQKMRLIASRCFMAGSLLMPAGFLLGGVVIYDGDPGLGVALVPVGALLMLVAVWLTARAARHF
jgi:hypothetical protein